MIAELKRLEEKVDRLFDFVAGLVASLREDLLAAQQSQPEKPYYNTEEAAVRLKLAVFTVQQKCRSGEIKAEKSNALSGPHAQWAISHAEILRYEREGPRRL